MVSSLIVREGCSYFFFFVMLCNISINASDSNKLKKKKKWKCMFSEKRSTEYPFQKKTENEHVTWTGCLSTFTTHKGSHDDSLTTWTSENINLPQNHPLLFQKLVFSEDGAWRWWYSICSCRRCLYGLLCDAWLFPEKAMATHSSVIAWRIPRMGEPGGLPSMGLHRVGHD